MAEFYNDVDVHGSKIVNSGTATADTDVPNWVQVQNLLRGLKFKGVRLRATGNVDISQLNNGDTLDGIVVATSDEVLLDQQTSATEDGIYTIGATAGTTVRSLELPTGASASPLTVTVEEGSTHGDKVFVQTSDPAIVGTNGLAFTVLGGGTTYTADESTITLVGSQFSVVTGGITPTQLSFDPATQTELDAHLNDTGDAHDASAISYAGGTGMSATDVEAAIDELATEKANAAITLTAGAGLTGGGDLSANRTFAIDTSVVARIASADGTGSSATFAYTHSLNKSWVLAQVVRKSDNKAVEVDWVITDANTVTFTFAASQTLTGFRFIVVG